MGCLVLVPLAAFIGVMGVFTSAVLGFFLAGVTAMTTSLAGLIGLVMLL
jgi:hypothetical protein